MGASTGTYCCVMSRPMDANPGAGSTWREGPTGVTYSCRQATEATLPRPGVRGGSNSICSHWLYRESWTPCIYALDAHARKLCELAVSSGLHHRPLRSCPTPTLHTGHLGLASAQLTWACSEDDFSPPSITFSSGDTAQTVIISSWVVSSALKARA